MKLRSALINQIRLKYLGWKVSLEHQDGCPNLAYWYLETNIPYYIYILGRTSRTWTEYFKSKYQVWRFLKKYYKHHINFWDDEQLEADYHLYAHLIECSPFPYKKYRRF